MLVLQMTERVYSNLNKVNIGKPIQHIHDQIRSFFVFNITKIPVQFGNKSFWQITVRQNLLAAISKEKLWRKKKSPEFHQVLWHICVTLKHVFWACVLANMVRNVSLVDRGLDSVYYSSNVQDVLWTWKED